MSEPDQWGPAPGLFREAQTRRGAQPALTLLLAYTVIAILGCAMNSSADELSTFWPCNGIAAAGLLLLSRRWAVAVVAMTVLVDYLCTLLSGCPPTRTAITVTADLSEVLLATLLVRRFCGAAIDVMRPRRLAALAGLAVLPATLIVGTAGTIVFGMIWGGDFFVRWLAWAVGDFLGMMVGLPTTLLLMRPDRFDRGPRVGRIEQFVIPLIVGLLAVVIFRQDKEPISAVLIPVVIFAAFRLTPPYALVTALVACAAATYETLTGHGPLAAPTASNLTQRVIVLQAFVAAVLFSTLFSAAALDQRNQTERRLNRALERSRAARREAAEALQNTRMALSVGGMAVWHYHAADGRIDTTADLKALLGFEPAGPVTIADLQALAPGQAWEEQLRAQLAGPPGVALEDELQVWPPGQSEPIWLLVRREVGRGETAAGRVVTGIAVDITERRLQAEGQDRLLAELNHRVKNTLSLVLAIMDQTARSGEAPATVIDRVRRRLIALSKTHNVLASRAWKGVEIADLMADELTPHGFGETGRIRISGEPVTVGPKGAVELGMIFHELTTNAVKYGALSCDEGYVSVDWALETRDGRRELVLIWKESGGPPVTPPLKQGFGTRMIQRGFMRGYPDGVSLLFEASGLKCVLRLPFERLMTS